MRRRSRTLLLLTASILLVACASSGSRFPVVEQAPLSDATRDCAALGDELDRVAVLRRAIAQETGELNAADTLGVALNTLTFPPLLIVQGLPTLIGASARNRRFSSASDAADARLQVLIRLRQERSCESASSELAVREDVLAAALEANTGRSAGARKARAEAVEAFLAARAEAAPVETGEPPAAGPVANDAPSPQP